ncbi:angiotensin-converting enzyme-like [Homalodisca vitripennis]|uniref:angiotensin-converting enzyme-like n=1 Tax=Homalodisca vitripennis TaxID=197043 RepID=UPI001EEB8BD0|nr:angiotensin-converting enzyme-like [Homalodisca vitripennis]
MLVFFALFLLSAPQAVPEHVGLNDNVLEASQFLQEYNEQASDMCYRVKAAQWAYSTNLTEYNKAKMKEEQEREARFQKASWRRASTFAWSRFTDPQVYRQLKILTTRGRAALADYDMTKLQHIIQEMKDLYTTTRVCPYSGQNSPYCDLSLVPDLTRTLAHSRNYEEQLHVWRSWHNSAATLKPKYVAYVDLINKAAQLQGFRDASEQERAVYEEPNWAQHMAELWSRLVPLYQQLHTYVRRRLHEYYGPRRVRLDGPLPAHILGNMWGQSWKNIFDIVIPYPGKRRVDVTSEMIRQGYNPIRMFQLAEQFFTSMGMKPMPVEFWQRSMFERPANRPIACKASAWDFCNQKDYRMKQCTEVTMEGLLTTHHEMTHIQYYLQYAHLPYLFRDGANPGFHEAVSEAIGLSVVTPRHMHRIGLLNNITDDYETKINFLLEMALEKVAYLPFAYLVDQWRWAVQAEGTHAMNARWWALRLHHQGVVPPIPRNESHFDPGAKYHIISDQPYIRYFVSLVFQFQLHASLCHAAQHVGPLDSCDIFRSREAGRLLSSVMSVGASQPWPAVVRLATQGYTSGLDPQPMLEYFRPLMVWLQRQNRDEFTVGWFTSPSDTALFGEWSTGSALKFQPSHRIIVTLLYVVCLIVLYF